MRFEDAYFGWTEKRLTQGEAARLLGVCDRAFSRYIDRYDENGLDGLIDLRLEQVSHRRAPVDDGTNEHYDMFFVDEEGTASSFRGVKTVIESHGLFCSFYSDRGSHYWHTPQAGGKVDKQNPTQFGRVMRNGNFSWSPAFGLL